jgi:hypothetical protein
MTRLFITGTQHILDHTYDNHLCLSAILCGECVSGKHIREVGNLPVVGDLQAT